jgi:transcription elongation factor GreA
LKDEVIPACGRRLKSAQSDAYPNIAAEYQRALSELADISDVLREAVDAEDLPADPDVVELGDTVTIEMPDGGLERYVIVHPAEAPIDSHRISSESPMSEAILGRRPGERVEVAAPFGTFEVTIRNVVR